MNSISSDGQRHLYQDPTATVTLREGLAEYFDSNPTLIQPEELSNPRAAELFSCHDAIHVMFGTNTDLAQEGMTDMWTLWGTDVGFKTFLSYFKEPEATAVIKDIGMWKATKEFVLSAPYIWRIWRHSRRMSKRWSFYGWQDQLDRPLNELRAEYGLELVTPPPSRAEVIPMPKASA